jgi:hypothetical protein
VLGWLVFKFIPRWLYASFATYLIGIVIGWYGNGIRLGAQIDRIHADHAIASREATARVLADTERMHREKQNAIEAAQAIARRNADAAAGARREHDRLRSEIATARDLTNATSASVIEYANTLGVVFNQCVAEYTDLAAKADGHALDAETIYSAWRGVVGER